MLRLLAPLALLSAPAGPVGSPPAALVDRLRAATVTIEPVVQRLVGEEVRTSGGQGSGFFLNTSRGPLVVTAAHVVAEASGVMVRGSDGRAVPVTHILFLDPALDLAILGTGAGTPGVALDGGGIPAVGEGVTLVSAPLGLTQTVTPGTVASVRGSGATRLIQLNAGVAPGSSGGLVADRNGRAVGVIVAKLDHSSNADGITFAAPLDVLAARSFHEEAWVPEPRPDAMVYVATHEGRAEAAAEALAEAGLRGRRGAWQTRLDAGPARAEHVCVYSEDPHDLVAVTPVGAEEPVPWLPGRSCTTAPDGEIEVTVATWRAGAEVRVRVLRQPW